MSLKVEVELSSAFQTRLSLERLTLSFEEDRPTLRRLLKRLVEEHGEKIRPLIFDKEEEIIPGLMVMVNDQIFTPGALSKQELRLKEKDKVSLLYFMSGG